MSADALKLGISAATGWMDQVTGWRAGCMVLYYHEIPARHAGAFARQMDMLMQHATVVSAMANVRRIRAPVCAAVTFDDGFALSIHRARRALSARRIPVTLFIPAAYIGGPPGWPTGSSTCAAETRIVSAPELRELASDPGVTIGSHGLHHRAFSTLTESEARHELLESKQRLEDIIEQQVRAFSFPYGDARPQHVRWARDAGYTHIFGTQPVPARPDDELIGRVRVDPWDSPRSFALKIRGAYRWMPAALALKRPFSRKQTYA